MRAATVPLVLCAAALVAVGGWQFADFRSQRDELEREHRRQGAALLTAVEGLATRELRGGRYDPDSLAATLDEAVTTFGLESVEVRTERGELLGSAGGSAVQPAALHVFEGRFQPLRPRRPDRPGGWGVLESTRPLPEGAMTARVVLPEEALRQALARRAGRSVVTTAALALAILSFGAVSWLRTRALELRATVEADRRKLESLETLRRLGAGLVHETKNPLGVVRGHAERIARRALPPAELLESARAILDETDRTVARLDEFLLYSRPAELRRARVDVPELFRELARLLSPDLEAAGATLALDCAGDATLDADRDQLRRLLLNLLLNAIQALDPGGHVALACRAARDPLQIAVEDDGRGVPDALRGTLFEPYVSQREGGTGLGLSIAARIATDHGFELRYEPRAPRGTRMVLEVPRT